MFRLLVIITIFYYSQCQSPSGLPDFFKPLPTTSGPPKHTLSIIHIDTPPVYSGYGKVRLTCAGSGDNRTVIHWIRNDSKGISVQLNNSKFDDLSQIWTAELIDRGLDHNNFPYKYQCVASNKCCPTVTSSVIEVQLDPKYSPDRCPVTQIPNKKLEEIKKSRRVRSVEVTWKYLPDPEDKGISFTLLKETRNISSVFVDIAGDQKITFTNLDPFTRYQLSWKIIYGNNCRTIPISLTFSTLEDFPGLPRNLTVVAVTSTTVNIMWLPPQVRTGSNQRYRVFWKPAGTGEGYQHMNISNRLSHVIKDLQGSTNYSIAVMTVNNRGNGNKSRAVYALTLKPDDKRNASTPSLRILAHPLAQTYSLTKPVNMTCSGEGDNSTSVHWTRQDVEGNLVRVNSTTIDHGSSRWTATIVDNPAKEKQPYQYQCVAANKCCGTVRSPLTRVEYQDGPTRPPTRGTFPALVLPTTSSKGADTLSIIHIETPPVYSGYGKVRLTCAGSGDNRTVIHWIRNDSKGISVQLNNSKFADDPMKIWSAELIDRGLNHSNFPYKYQCVASNKCCPTVTSSVIEVQLDPKYSPDRCPIHKMPYKKLEELKRNPRERSVEFLWKYLPDPEDSGVSFTLFKGPRNISTVFVDIAADRKITFKNLDPFTTYNVHWEIIYGNNCKTLRVTVDFTTLEDFPGLPRNLTVVAVTSTSVNITWLPPKVRTGSNQRYRVFWKPAGTGKEYQQMNISNPRSHVIKDLQGSTNYSIAVMTVNNRGNGNKSRAVYALTLKPDEKPPGLPMNVKISSVSSTEVNVTWMPPKNPNGDTVNYTVFWKRSEAEEDSYDSVNVADHRSYVIRNLEESTNYSVAVMAVNEHGKGNKTQPVYAVTLKPEEKPPGLPLNVTIPSVSSTEITVAWMSPRYPNGDILYYRVLWKRTEAQDDNYKSATIRDHRHYVISKLEESTSYSIAVMAVNEHGNGNKTDPVNAVTLKPEGKPPGLPVNVKISPVSSTEVNVTWMPPRNPNDDTLNYTVFWKRSEAEEDRYKSETVRDHRHYVIKDLMVGANYSVSVMAINQHGKGNRTSPVFAVTSPNSEPKKGGRASDAGAIAGSVVAVVFFIVLIIAGFFLLRRRRRRKRQLSVKSFHEMHNQPVDNLDSPEDEDVHPLPVPDPVLTKSDNPEEISYIVLLDDWEILRENLKVLDKKLGGGQFGVVKQGLYTTGKNDSELVAVKMLKEGAREHDRDDLLTELKILKEVNKEPHPNVLRLIGACSTAGPLLVVTEFCPGGNLRRFLLNSRVDSKSESSSYINLSSTLTHRQLLKIAVDVANGMIHLASHKFVHRDLAARNVLIGEDDVAKLSDFGLARDVKEAEEYIRNNQNLLPVKWMAIESLLHGRFTTASDIWSFGVLLYEITTLGDEPYPGISPHYIVAHVGSGCRMDKPPHCSDEVYDIMTNCWSVDPHKRPTFQEIHASLHAMLTDDERSYINVRQIMDEGPLTTQTHHNNVSLKEGSVRYTKA